MVISLQFWKFTHQNGLSNLVSKINNIVLQPSQKSPLTNKGPPKKFPLLSQNYVINEATNEEMETKLKSPLEVFNFPGPPNDPPDKFYPDPDKLNLDKLNHYSIKNSNGHFDEYAAVPEQNTSIPNNFSNFGSTPKSIIKKPIKPKTLIEANYDPFNKNYSAISSSRYST